MLNSLIKNISDDFKALSSGVLLVEDNNRFLFRADVTSALKEEGILISHGTSLKQRVDFELRDDKYLLVLLSDQRKNYLEDIERAAVRYEFFLDKYLNSYHIPAIINEDLNTLDALFKRNPVISLSKQETLAEIRSARSDNDRNTFDIDSFKRSLAIDPDLSTVDWNKIMKVISNGLITTIGTDQYNSVIDEINRVNDIFQQHLKSNYAQLKKSNPVKSPKIVSKILDYIDFNFSNDKIALIVIDGLSLWQYRMFNDKLNGKKQENIIYAWLPSITQLSRQAIFRGKKPERSYRQNPDNEDKLWKQYWKDKGFNEFEIKYEHDSTDIENLISVKRLALVFNDLDDYMHSSKDYTDLLKLTENWIDRSGIVAIIDKLLQEDFKVFITSDHGNIHAKGWRKLKGREKLGTNKSGSRSERHIEYSEKWLKDELLISNPELKDSVIQDKHAIYFKTDSSFSSKKSLVTHGGSHILEVLVPFIVIKNEA